MHKSEIHISIRDLVLNATLTIPEHPIGLVIFSHGSGSGRNSPRNQFVARELNDAKIATLLLDLLTLEEEAGENAGGMLRFDIDMLSERLLAAALWSKHAQTLSALPIALFGASTGAASALRVAAKMPNDIVAIVSRGGRPDMAMAALPKVLCPVLLIVGGDDDVVIKLNQKAFAALSCKKQLELVPGATHLFEEPGTLEIVAEKARHWFVEAFSVAK